MFGLESVKQAIEAGINHSRVPAVQTLMIRCQRTLSIKIKKEQAYAGLNIVWKSLINRLQRKLVLISREEKLIDEG